MIVQYCSDLHLEFPENQKWITHNPIEPFGDILVLAGDIVSFAAMGKRNNFFDYISDNFETTYWIPGNHEYYDSDVTKRSGAFQEKIRENVFLVNNEAIVHDNTQFIFSTMWSAISELNQWKIENYISDFRTIRYKDKMFSVENFNELHKTSLGFITGELEKPWNGNKVVVTHHVPTFMNYPKKHKADPLNEAFAAELCDLIERTRPQYWIYGHHHHNAAPFLIGETILLTNQLGYVHRHEHGQFNAAKHFRL